MMYLNIKLEQNEDKKASKDLSSIAIEDGATIGDLKRLLEGYVDMNVQHMQIRNLAGTHHDDVQLQSLIKSSACEVTFMLYSTKDKSAYDDTKFICFLGIYRNREDASRLPMAGRTRFHCDEQVIVDSDSERSTDSSSTSSESGTSNTNSDDSVETKTTHKRQDRLLERQRVAEQKDIRNKYVSEYPSMEQKRLLTEFEEIESNNEFQPATTGVAQKVSLKCSKRLFSEEEEKDTKRCRGEVSEGVTKIPDCGGNPWNIDPQKRQYIVIISNARQDREMNKEDFSDVCYEYSQCFKSAEPSMAKILSFLPNTPLLFEGKLYIMCNNEATSCWVRQQNFKEKWLVERFEVFHQLRKCHLVLPYIDKIKEMAEILEILEAQNVPLKTDLWVIRDCRKCQADDDYTRTSFVGDHSILELLIDGDSEQLLVSFNYQLKYCFWKIDVQMC